MSHGEDPGDDGSVALEQRLQGEPGLQDLPGGAAPGLHSRHPPGPLPQATGGFQIKNDHICDCFVYNDDKMKPQPNDRKLSFIHKTYANPRPVRRLIILISFYILSVSG